jgi:hypothetical protein
VDAVNREEVREVVQEAVRETLVALGIDAADPIQTQADLAWLRRMRKATASAASKIGAAVIGILVTALAGAIWLGARALLRQGP